MKSSVKALVVRDDRVLLLRKSDPAGDRYTLPGGRQEPGETLVEALQRECEEEIGTRVILGGLRFVADSLRRPFRPEIPVGEAHTVMFFFLCDVPPGYEPAPGHGPDPGQAEVVWVPLGELVDIRLFPVAIKELLLSRDWPAGPVYLGAIT